jgi:hypothetical protein
MMSNSLAASAGGSALHRIRVQKSAWPPPQDVHGLLSGVLMPTSLREHIAVLAYLIGGGCEEDVEAVCERLAAEDREQEKRTAALEEHRRELIAAEERNEKLRSQLAAVEATGGVDTGEHLELREQLTEMQAQGVAIRAAEERHAAVLEQLAGVTSSLLAELDAVQTGVPPAAPPPLEREALKEAMDGAIAQATRMMPALRVRGD